MTPKNAHLKCAAFALLATIALGLAGCGSSAVPAHEDASGQEAAAQPADTAAGITPEAREAYETCEPIVLDPWDPMGALA